MTDQLIFDNMKRPFDVLTDFVESVPVKFEEIYSEREKSDAVFGGSQGEVKVELWIPDQALEEYRLGGWDLEEMGELTVREWLNQPFIKEWWAKTIKVEIDKTYVWIDSYQDEVSSYDEEKYQNILARLTEIV